MKSVEKDVNKAKKAKKGKGRALVIIAIIVGVVVVIGAVGAIACSAFTAKEHEEVMNLPIAAIDFGNLKDGSYIGRYEGGMAKLRTNEVKVTVASGRVTGVELLESKENRPPEFTNELFGRVMKEQSLQVDAVSGATITTKAFLKSIENALMQAK